MSQKVVRSSVIGAMAIVLLTATPAFALYRQLSTQLAGPSIAGVVPSGNAKVDQSRLPNEPLTLEVRVKNVNLPNGTVLSVVLTDCWNGPAGSLTLSGGQAEFRKTVPFCEVGRSSAIHIKSGDQLILAGGNPWQV
jgi:hypothetical protein